MSKQDEMEVEEVARTRIRRDFVRIDWTGSWRPKTREELLNAVVTILESHWDKEDEEAEIRVLGPRVKALNQNGEWK